MIASPEEICADIQTSLVDSGLYSPDRDAPWNTWRIAPEAFGLTARDVAFFEDLGGHLLAYYGALNQLYFESVKGRAPAWVAEYLDAGKPPDLVEYARMKRFRTQLPGILRPDVIVTESGFAVTELDSVPGGFGLTARLMALYARHGEAVVGLDPGIPTLFYRMLESLAGFPNCTAAIVVSDEAKDYLSEMEYLGNLLKENGFPVYVVHPREVIFREEGLFVKEGDRETPIEVLYRFYELFDLKNIPKVELLMFSNKKGRVRTTPPYKPFLEEKSSFALFHHPALQVFWEKALGAETFDLLRHLIPDTWILDNRPLPPHAVIPGVTVRDMPVSDWSELMDLTQKERELVLKVSGFSPEAWGSRGVVIGHDVSGEEWKQSLKRCLREFPGQPWVLQKFYKGKRFKTSFWNHKSRRMETMESRVRLTPYYFVIDAKARLGGILATLCPHDKKKIHGMVDAVMVPCSLKEVMEPH